MHREEWEHWSPCVDCGVAVSDVTEGCFTVGDEVLCWECAIRRGGIYDTEAERWTLEPDVSDLTEALRPWGEPSGGHPSQEP